MTRPLDRRQLTLIAPAATDRIIGLDPAVSMTLHESKSSFVSLIEYIYATLSFLFAHVTGFSGTERTVRYLPYMAAHQFSRVLGPVQCHHVKWQSSVGAGKNRFLPRRQTPLGFSPRRTHRRTLRQSSLALTQTEQTELHRWTEHRDKGEKVRRLFLHRRRGMLVILFRECIDGYYW